jgi:hypothetical protein
MKIVRMTDKDKVNIIRGYTVELKTMIEMAKEIGVSRQAIKKALNKAGIDTSKAVAAHILVSCTVCGKEVSTKRCAFRRSKHHFCGKDCYTAWLKHGNGNPLIMHRHSGRIARAVVSAHFALTPAHIVHHEDRNQYNNTLGNLRVFANQGDHIRYHRGFMVPILWGGLTI